MEDRSCGSIRLGRCAATVLRRLQKEPRERAAKLRRSAVGIAVALVESYSALTKMGNAELAEQLKMYKLLEKRTGFKTTGTGPDMRLQLQLLSGRVRRVGSG